MADATLGERVNGRGGEETLASRAVAGDVGAFDALIAPRLDVLYRIALAILRHEADARDAVQDACVKAWRELPRLREPERIDAWLGRIVVNACRDQLRSRRRTTVREIDVAVVTNTAASNHAGAVDDDFAQVDAVRRAFLRLSADDRVLLALHYAEQRPLVEIASLTGKPVGTIKWRLHEARKSLAYALEREQ